MPAGLLSSGPEPAAPFGIMFDIDGVIVRGRKVLPFAPEVSEVLIEFTSLINHDYNVTMSSDS
jgi:hypothetical protein